MAIEPVNTGSAENDGTGEPLRNAFVKINASFAYLVELCASFVTSSTLTGTLASYVTSSTFTSALSAKQDSLGFTAENVSNKSTDINGDQASNTKYAAVKALYDWATGLFATKSYAESLVVGLLDDRGSFDASGNVYPSTGGSGTAGAILKGDLWFIGVAGTLGGTYCQIGTSVRALTDTPGQTAANWDIIQTTLGFTPENQANKSTSVDTDKTSDIKFPSVKSVYDWATGLFATLTTAQTLTNKRITNRVGETASSATPSINTDLYDVYKLTAQAADITSFTTNLSGTPTDFQLLVISITGTATRNIGWGSSFEASTVALPTATSGTATLDVTFRWNTATSKWRCVGAA